MAGLYLDIQNNEANKGCEGLLAMVRTRSWEVDYFGGDMSDLGQFVGNFV